LPVASAVVVELADPFRFTVAPAPAMVSVPEITAVTVSAKPFELIPFWDAVMLVVPLANPVASPLELILAFAGVELAQFTVFIKFCVLPSLNLPVAVNCSVSPIPSDVLGAVTLIDCSAGAATVRVKPLELMPL